MFPDVICNIIMKYAIGYKKTLLDWVNINNLNFRILSGNPNAIDLLLANQKKNKMVYDIK